MNCDFFFHILLFFSPLHSSCLRDNDEKLWKFVWKNVEKNFRKEGAEVGGWAKSIAVYPRIDEPPIKFAFRSEYLNTSISKSGRITPFTLPKPKGR